MDFLPVKTVVRITGNYRTAWKLLDRVGTVCGVHETGIGGWHTVRLRTGERVKIQRNALTVMASRRTTLMPQRSSFE